MLNIGTVVALIKSMQPEIDPDVINSSVVTYLNAHPELICNITDGSVTEAKLATALAAKIALITQHSEDIADIKTATANDVGKALSPKTVADGVVTEWQYKVIGSGGSGGVSDVQVNGTSITDGDGVANIPIASANTLGLVRVRNSASYGVKIDSGGSLDLQGADNGIIKDGSVNYRAVTPAFQHSATFYGLAKAAGDSTQASSSNAVGTYTETAMSKISEMLNAPVSVSGSTPSITALAGVKYVCGECSTLDITLPASGIVDVVFESGSTATVLTITPPTGTTVKWANGFDPTSLDASTTYEINIADGLGVACAWT